MPQINKNFDNEVKDIIINLLKSKNKNVPEFNQNTKIKDILDYVEIRRVSFEIDDKFKIDSHAMIDTVATLKDLYSVVNCLVAEKESKKLQSPFPNKEIAKRTGAIIVKIFRTKGKKVPSFTNNTKLKDILDYIEIRKLFFMLDDSFKINSHAVIEQAETIEDVYNIVSALVFNKEFNIIRKTITDFFKTINKPLPTINGDTNLREILDYVELRRLVFTIDDIFKIDSHAFVDDIVTVKDLCFVVDVLHAEKSANKKIPEQIISPKDRMFQKQKEQVFKEIKDMLESSFMLNDQTPTLNSLLDFNPIETDLSVLEAIEKKYNIVISELPYNIKTVNDLCNLIVKQRIAKFHTDKHTYNNSVKYTPAPIQIIEKPLDLQYFGPYYYIGVEPPLSVRIQYRLAQLKQALSR